jgi:hypothetical protein
MLVFAAARWLLQRTPLNSDIPELLIVVSMMFFATFV